MEAQVAVAKIPKYASSASGDTIEMIERPSGGLSFVLVDGQWSGKPAKRISNVVARKAISLLAEGVRDGAAARAASDYLYTYREGKVQATLNILSIDLITQTLVITRNSPAPVILVRGGEMALLDSPTESVGTRRGTRPSITASMLRFNTTSTLPVIKPRITIAVTTSIKVKPAQRRPVHLRRSPPNAHFFVRIDLIVSEP